MKSFNKALEEGLYEKINKILSQLCKMRMLKTYQANKIQTLCQFFRNGSQYIYFPTGFQSFSTGSWIVKPLILKSLPEKDIKRWYFKN